MITQQAPLMASADRTGERRVASEPLAMLPEFFWLREPHPSRQASIGFSYLTKWLLRLAVGPR
jgi:hypothetical protein